MATEPETEESPLEEELLVEEEIVVAAEQDSGPRDIVSMLMDNPLVAGLGALVAMLLGGVLWRSLRRKNKSGLFDDELTLEMVTESERQ